MVVQTRLVKLFTFGHIGIALYPFIFIHPDYYNATVINHERIHIAQQKELWIIGFYILYIYFWIINLFKFKSFKTAYLKIPFEYEAYYNQERVRYLSRRKPHNWRNFLS